MYILEIDHIQAALLTDVLDQTDRAGQIPPGKALPFAGILQQLRQPQETGAVLARIRAQVQAEMTQPGVPANPQPQQPK